MKIALGTSLLDKNFNNKYWEIFQYFINNKLNIHSSENYKHTDQYFALASKLGLPNSRIITKIYINKNPLKKILFIKKQMKVLKNKYKTFYPMKLQICNNPHYNYLNQLLLKTIFFKERKNFNQTYLECFYDYSNNIEKVIDNKIYCGVICTFNLFYRGISLKLLNKIKNSKKKIIAISPFASGRLQVEYNSNYAFKKLIRKLLDKYKLSLVEFNITFLKEIGLIQEIIIGTKKLERFKQIEKIIEKTKKVKISQIDIDSILKMQKHF